MTARKRRERGTGRRASESGRGLSAPTERAAGALRPCSHRPFITVNFALTWDGKITTRNLTSADFSSRRDKRRLLEIRATGDAVLVGKTTVERENIPLGLPHEDLRAERVARGQAPYPMRVIVTNSGRIDPSLKLFQRDFSPIVIYSTTRMPEPLQAELGARATLHLTDGDAVDLKAMLRHLRSHYDVKRLVCEGGAELFRSLLAARFVDEINLTFCPRIFGGERAPTLTGVPGDFLPETVRCRLEKMEVAGEECFVRYRVRRR
jgi:2,5-diamino-6-(ribosylamino)-4(3H)-pyrimidinone 5'-phosphate reductase